MTVIPLVDINTVRVMVAHWRQAVLSAALMKKVHRDHSVISCATGYSSYRALLFIIAFIHQGLEIQEQVSRDQLLRNLFRF